jgi:NADH-quinone oxidoreductase subunit N
VFGTITNEMILAVLPEIALLVLVAIVFIVDLVLAEKQRGGLAWLTAAGLAMIFVITLLFAKPSIQSELVWGGMLRHDWLAYIFKLLFIATALFTTLLTVNWTSIWHKGEFYVLLLTSTLGMTLMAASADLIMLFLAIETTSIPRYIMAGFMTEDDKSTESGFKYLLFGAMTTAVMLYGLSLLYGFAGTTNLYDMASAISAAQVPGFVGSPSLLGARRLRRRTYAGNCVLVYRVQGCRLRCTCPGDDRGIPRHP